MAEKYHCKVCGKVFQTRGTLEDHTENKHVQVERIECKVCGKVFFDGDCFHYHLRQKCSSQGRKIKSAFKSIKVPREALKKENNVDSIMTELNTMVNGTSNEKERKLIQVVKNLTILNEELQVKCQLGEKQCEEKHNMKTHKPEYHGENSIQNDCETCERQLNAKSNLKSPKFEHYGDANIYTESFLSHHVEEDDDEHIELNSGLWDILLSETDESDLTDEEKKEVLKLHRYFAHRSGRKLWENLFHPAGRFKGKKKKVLEFLSKCEV